MDTLQRTVPLPQIELVVDRALRRQVLRQRPESAAIATNERRNGRFLMALGQTAGIAAGRCHSGRGDAQRMPILKPGRLMPTLGP